MADVFIGALKVLLWRHDDDLSSLISEYYLLLKFLCFHGHYFCFRMLLEEEHRLVFPE